MMKKKLIHFLNVISIFDECHSCCCFFSHPLLLLLLFLFLVVVETFSQKSLLSGCFYSKFPVVFIFSRCYFFSLFLFRAKLKNECQTNIFLEKKLKKFACSQTNHNIYLYIERLVATKDCNY